MVSLNIRPYLEAVEGVRAVFKKAGIDSEIFSLEDFTGKRRKALTEKLAGKDLALFVAVGPEAARFIWAGFQENPPAIYTMVLDPEKLAKAPQKLCGISLSVPVSVQVRKIGHVLPDIKRIGLLYDPRYNQPFFFQANESAADMGLRIVPLQVSSRKEIPLILQQHWQDIDGIWFIPDRTIISESIIRYIIKEALLKEKPVIGYNRFFYESGAALNFIFDYGDLGRQTAELAVQIIAGSPCRTEVPAFQLWLNDGVIEKLGLTCVKEGTEGVTFGP